MLKTEHCSDHVMVIGAGIGSLAAAMRLRALGYRVTILERHPWLGGKIRTVPSDAGPIDAGPTVLTLRHVFDDLFACFGAKLEEHVNLVQNEVIARHFWPDGSTLDLYRDQHKTAEAVQALAGAKTRMQFETFCARTQRLFEAFDTPMMQAADPNIAALAGSVLSSPRLIPAMAPLSTMKQLLKRSFSDPRLRQLFGRYATYVGGSPGHSPAILSLIWQAEAQGVWIVEGGMHRLVEAIAMLLTRAGVEIKTEAHVERLEMQGGLVRAVHLADGDRVACDLVVFGGDPRALATGELGSSLTAIASQTADLPRSFSARVHSFAAKPAGPELSHHNIFFDQNADQEFDDLMAGRIPANPSIYLCALDRGQTEEPQSIERFEIITNAPPDPEPAKDIDQWHHQIMQKMARFGMTFSPTPGPETVTTPAMFNAMFPATCGALYGQTPHGLTASLKRPRARTQIPNLYLVGGGTHPGAGVPMAALSARHAVDAILRDQTSMSTSAQTAMRGGMSTA